MSRSNHQGGVQMFKQWPVNGQWTSHMLYGYDWSGFESEIIWFLIRTMLQWCAGHISSSTTQPIIVCHWVIESFSDSRQSTVRVCVCIHVSMWCDVCVCDTVGQQCVGVLHEVIAILEQCECECSCCCCHHTDHPSPSTVTLDHKLPSLKCPHDKQWYGLSWPDNQKQFTKHHSCHLKHQTEHHHMWTHVDLLNCIVFVKCKTFNTFNSNPLAAWRLVSCQVQLASQVNVPYGHICHIWHGVSAKTKGRNIVHNSTTYIESTSTVASTLWIHITSHQRLISDISNQRQQQPKQK